MRRSVLLIILFSLLSCKKQINKKTFIEEFQWEITLPSNFKKINEEKWEKTKNEGKENITNNTNLKLINESKLIFVIENGEFNRFDANYMSKKLFVAPNTTFKKSFDKINTITYDSFLNTAPNAKIDTTSSIEIIDGLKFYKFEMNTKIDESFVINSKSYKRLFNDKVLSININYINNELGIEMLNSLRNSKFKKN